MVMVPCPSFSATFSDPLPHTGGEDPQLVPVLRYGPSGDVHPLRFQEGHNGLIREGLLRVFVIYQGLDLGFHAPGRDVLTGAGGETTREEELQGEHASGGLNELFVRDPGDGGLVPEVGAFVEE